MTMTNHARPVVLGLLLSLASVAACDDETLEPGEGEGEGEGETGEGEGEGEKDEGEGEGETGGGEGETGEGEGEGEGEPPPDVDVVINEVFCRDPEGIEIVNRADTALDLTRVQLGDRPRDLEAPLVGTLEPGARRIVVLSARIACGTEGPALAVDGVVVDRAPKRLVPHDASIGRFPDASGPFAVVTPTRGTENLAYEDVAAQRLFATLDTPVPTTLPQLDITLPPASEAELRIDPPTRVKVEATVAFTDATGTVTSSASVRLKGLSSYRPLDQKAAFKIDFGDFGGTPLFGVEHLTLNNMVQDNSASRERLFYGLLDRHQLPAPRRGMVRVSVNGVDVGNSFALEAHDEESFLGRFFSSSAHVYEGEYGEDLFMSQLNNFDEDYGDDVNREHLAALLTALEAAYDQPGFMANTAAIVDWPRVIENFAVDMVMSHFDSYTSDKNNFYLHLDDDGVLTILSSGADQAFTQDIGLRESTARLFLQCLADSECGDLYDAAVVVVGDDLAAWLDGGGRQRLRDDAVTLRALYATDTRIPWDHNQIVPEVEQLITTLDARVALTRP